MVLDVASDVAREVWCEERTEAEVGMEVDMGMNANVGTETGMRVETEMNFVGNVLKTANEVMVDGRADARKLASFVGVKEADDVLSDTAIDV